MRSLQTTLSPSFGPSVSVPGVAAVGGRNRQEAEAAQRGGSPNNQKPARFLRRECSAAVVMVCVSQVVGGGAFAPLGFGSISSSPSFKWCRPALCAPMGRKEPKKRRPRKGESRRRRRRRRRRNRVAALSRCAQKGKAKIPLQLAPPPRPGHPNREKSNARKKEREGRDLVEFSAKLVVGDGKMALGFPMPKTIIAAINYSSPVLQIGRAHV